MDTPKTPIHPITSLLGSPIVQIGIIVVSLLVLWATTENPNRRFTFLFLIMNLIVPLITLIVVALVIAGLVWVIFRIAGRTLNKQQFERCFFGIYVVLIFLRLIISFIGNMAG
ncbi:MAG TPA: hypothetical protein VGO68_21755 [Pyrinomonadaceae bacterium]|jgi:hypothetical protein|nr:hypothetical protein [Pyrinomonadaceae bacterium]